MSTTATPPPKKVNRIGLEVLNYKGAKTTLMRRLRPQRHFRAHHRMLLRAGRAALERRQIFRHRLLVEIARRISWACRTDLMPCTAACRPLPPAPCWPTARCWASA